MAEKLKPIEGYTITTLPYGKIWHVCDTCGMAVAAEEISSHVKFDHDPTDSKLLKPMPGWTITRHANTAVVHICDTCGRAQTKNAQGLRGHLRDDHLAAYQQLQLSDRLQKLVTEYGLEAVVQQVGKIRQATPTTPAKKTPARRPPGRDERR